MRARLSSTVAGLVVIAGALAGCSGVHSSSSGTQGAATEHRLVRLLEPRPEGTRPGTQPWAHVTTPTATQFTRYRFGSSNAAKVAQELELNGLDAIAHRRWLVAGGGADLYLVEFDLPDDATEWLRFEMEVARRDPTVQEIHLPESPRVSAYHGARGADSVTKYAAYAQRGRIAIELISSFQTQPKLAELADWIRAQIVRLPIT